MTILYIFLAIIAFILWKIYRQKEDEKQATADEKFDAEWEIKKEAEKKEKFKDYPHLIGNMDDSYLEIYAHRKELNLKQAWQSYAYEANNPKSDSAEVDMLFHSLWDITEEFLEHLEKYHESTKHEYEIAINNYWRIVAEEAKSFDGKDTETIKKIFQSSPFTDIQKIALWFPKKSNHSEKEITFIDENGNFPRKSEGSKLIDERLKALGL